MTVDVELARPCDTAEVLAALAAQGLQGEVGGGCHGAGRGGDPAPVREALRRLAALGLVSFVPNRGVRVRTLSREELREAFLVRAELESLATELATPRIGDDGLQALAHAARRFSELTAALRTRTRE